jgi:hypothetical protein
VNDQLSGQLRNYLQIISSSLTTLGIITVNQGELWVSLIMAGFGIFGMATSAFLVWKANKKESIIASATNMPEVDSKKLAAAITDPELKAVANNPTPIEGKP